MKEVFVFFFELPSCLSCRRGGDQQHAECRKALLDENSCAIKSCSNTSAASRDYLLITQIAGRTELDSGITTPIVSSDPEPFSPSTH